eukprot:gnl/TRDRNA2_/TRDRNA2_198419_c0_seq1.p3 gnl/TRDRNA2_/TRDRNA2_198419_c0~~gnl/TRDRNA2_/TRDRNA2_198419_c0_seq1.p3  ORF type:complete len:102 (-),score=23.49 gnl/TRDRNA2_/TRDRNA2_198419_c0_seq1:90-395(-)
MAAKQPLPSVAEVLDGVIEREHTSGVRGAVCLDRNGFTLGSRGDLLPAQTAHIVAMSKSCKQLEPAAKESPVITLETNTRTVSVSARGDYVVALARKPSER